MRLRLAPVLVTGVLTLSACSISTPRAGTTPYTPEPAPPSTPTAPAPTLPVADAFGPATWGLTLPEAVEEPPVILGDRAVFIDGDRVRAVDPQGHDAWEAAFQIVDPETRTHDTNNYPFLRPAGPGVVAVVDQGKVASNSLDDNAYAVKVTLMNVDSGSVITSVTIPGTESSSPEPSQLGLAFTTKGNGTSVVLPNGKITQLPPEVTSQGKNREIDGGATVGSHIIQIWGNQSPNVSMGEAGFAGTGWDSNKAAPGAAYTTATIEASDADHLLVGRWVILGSGPSAAQVRVQIVDAASGQVLSKVDCDDPSIRGTMTASPNRQHHITGPLMLDATGNARCVGGEGNQKRVSLTAVTDDGRAFGLAGDELVDVAADGTAKTSPLPDGATAPVGIMTGNVAVHWDPSTHVLTGNPVL